jgi:serine/threonine-protein kinase
MAPVTQAQTVTVPDLRGQPIGAVTSTLIPLGLRFDMDGMEPSDTVPMNSIISQRPAPGTRVPPGTTIEVTVSRGPSPFGNNSP